MLDILRHLLPYQTDKQADRGVDWGKHPVLLLGKLQNK